MVKSVLVTGGCGFLGHHFIQHLHRNTDWNMVIVDKLNYASAGFDRIRDLDLYGDSRIKILTHDLVNTFSTGVEKEIGDISYIFHLAAETHVENSIQDPKPFIDSNVIGTYNLLEFARKCNNLKMMFYASTDEVYGSAPDNVFYSETDRHLPGNPYSATKSAAEQLCQAWYNTYKVPVCITNTMNLFGERQHPEKFIPLVMKNILNNKKTYIYSYPNKQRVGTRFYLHCRSYSSAILFLLDKARSGQVYNIVGHKEIDNLTLAQNIARILGKDLDYELVDFHSNRPGHDLRYSLDGTRMELMGWKLPLTFEESLEKMIRWYQQNNNMKWLDI